MEGSTIPLIPPDLKRHIFRNYPIPMIQPYLNLKMLLGKHLGLKGNVEELLKNGDERALELEQTVKATLAQAMKLGWLKAHGIYQFFPAQADGDEVLVYDPQGFKEGEGDQSEQGTGVVKVLERFQFPRQNKEPHLCLSDFLTSVESGVMDYIGIFAVTAGEGIREKAAELKEQGDYLTSYTLQALALESAEAFAERIHHLMRDAWGIPDPFELTMKERLAARYQGMRFSLGYPACPNIEDQTKIFRLINPQDIGIELTEGYMMDPEASVTALVFAHPEARYFSVV